MPRYLLSKADKVKKVQLSSRRKIYRSVTSYKSKRRNGAQKTVLDLDSLIDECQTYVTQNNELVEFATQFMAKLEVSPNLQSIRCKDTRHDKISAGENEVQAASNFSEAVQDNIGDLIQHGNISQISLSPRSETKTTNHFSTTQRKNIFMEEKRKNDSTLTTSTNNECKIKNLVTNQVGYVYSKFFYNFFHY